MNHTPHKHILSRGKSNHGSLAGDHLVLVDKSECVGVVGLLVAARLCGSEKRVCAVGVDGHLHVMWTMWESFLRLQRVLEGVGFQRRGGELLAFEGGECLVPRVHFLLDPGGNGVHERETRVVRWGDDRVRLCHRSLLLLQRTQQLVGRCSLRSTAALLLETRDEHLVGQRSELRIGLQNVEIGERLDVVVVQLTDIGVQEEGSDLGNRDKRKIHRRKFALCHHYLY